jgi:hypothetical protein
MIAPFDQSKGKSTSSNWRGKNAQTHKYMAVADSELSYSAELPKGPAVVSSVP